MVKLREKWIWGLCLAVLVHVGVFFIVYLNIDIDDSVIVNNHREVSSETDSNIKISEPRVVINISRSEESDVFVSGLETVETITDNQRTSILTDDSIDNKTTAPKKTGKHKDLESGKQDLSLSKKLKTNKNIEASEGIETNKGIKDQKDALPVTDDSVNESNLTLEEIKNNAGLLDMDVPTQISKVKIDQNYKDMKSEVEKTNSQLSDAINEVKKRNQQKIEQMQQL